MDEFPEVGSSVLEREGIMVKRDKHLIRTKLMVVILADNLCLQG